MIRAWLLLALLLAGPALAQPPVATAPLAAGDPARQLLFDFGAAGRLEEVGAAAGPDDRPRLRLTRGAALLWEGRARGFERLGIALRTALDSPRLYGVTGWSGGAYCCWTLHLFARTPRGLVHAGDIPLGKREPDSLQWQRPGEALLRIADPSHDFWDYLGSLGADIGPPVPYGWDGRRVAPDVAAMRRSTEAALAEGCVPLRDPAAFPDGMPALPRHAGLAEAVAALRADTGWASFRPGHPYPATEAARLVLCLVYAGQARAALAVLDAFPPDQAAQRAATERQLRARLGCSALAAALRRINPGSALIPATCQRHGADQTAVADLLERRAASPPRPAQPG